MWATIVVNFSQVCFMIFVLKSMNVHLTKNDVLSLYPGCRINPQFVFQLRIGGSLITHSVFCEFVREPCQHATWHCAGWRVHVYTQVFLGVRGHTVRWPRTKGTAVNEWMSSLFCGFLPHPFIHDMFLWHTSQEFVKTDLYPLYLMSLQYAVCSTGCWSIIGRCFGACNKKNQAI